MTTKPVSERKSMRERIREAVQTQDQLEEQVRLEHERAERFNAERRRLTVERDSLSADLRAERQRVADWEAHCRRVEAERDAAVKRAELAYERNAKLEEKQRSFDAAWAALRAENASLRTALSEMEQKRDLWLRQCQDITVARDALLTTISQAWKAADVAIYGPGGPTLAEHIRSTRVALSESEKQREALARFKAFVHERLDQGGVPVDLPGPHRDAGCRIGQRLDWLFSALSESQAREAALRGFVGSLKLPSSLATEAACLLAALSPSPVSGAAPRTYCPCGEPDCDVPPEPDAGGVSTTFPAMANYEALIEGRLSLEEYGRTSSTESPEPSGAAPEFECCKCHRVTTSVREAKFLLCTCGYTMHPVPSGAVPVYRISVDRGSGDRDAKVVTRQHPDGSAEVVRVEVSEPSGAAQGKDGAK